MNRATQFDSSTLAGVSAFIAGRQEEIVKLIRFLVERSNPRRATIKVAGESPKRAKQVQRQEVEIES